MDARMDNITAEGPEHPHVTSADIGGILAEFEQLIGPGRCPGAQFAVYKDGSLVLDAAGGRTVAGNPIRSESLLGILSASKALAAMVVHMLHDDGKFAYTDPVADHWPEFACNGKADITIEHVLSHRSGLAPPAFEGYLYWRRWSEPGGIAQLIEDMEPLWPPGSANGYHAHTFGHILDELVQRWTGQNLGAVLRERILEPLGIEDVYLGLPEDRFHRFVPFTPVPYRALVPDLDLPPGGEEHFFNSYEILRQCLPWGGGVARARDLAQLMNVFALEGTYRSLTVFSRDTFRRAVTPTNGPRDIDRVLGAPVRWGLGLILRTDPELAAARGSALGLNASASICGHLGGTSCVVWAEPERRLSAAFIATGAPPDPTGFGPLADAVRSAVD